MDNNEEQPAKKKKKTGRRPRENAPTQTQQDAGEAQLMNDHGWLPSQAEGERTAGDGEQSAVQSEVLEPKPTPSQAEGERDTVDEDLNEKGQGI
jgi:hypothetical protein